MAFLHFANLFNMVRKKTTSFSHLLLHMYCCNMLFSLQCMKKTWPHADNVIRKGSTLQVPERKGSTLH